MKVHFGIQKFGINYRLIFNNQRETRNAYRYINDLSPETVDYHGGFNESIEILNKKKWAINVSKFISTNKRGEYYITME